MMRMVAGLLIMLGFTGCGGGSPDAVYPPAQPALSWSPVATRSFAFNWSDVSVATDSHGGATEYRLLENPDGLSGYTQIATLGAGATSYTLTGVPLHLRVNARYILQACNAAGCTGSAPLSVSGTLAAAVGYFKASNTEGGDSFGCRVALSADGATLAVSACYESSGSTGVNGNQSDNSAPVSGAVYVFTLSDGNWSQQAYLKASNAEGNDQLGFGLALSADGSTLAVGAVDESSNATGVNGNQADNSASLSGAVYVFTRTGTAWSQQAYVKASNTGARDLFGISVALSADGGTLAVGAEGETSNATGIDGNQADDSMYPFFNGAVYVFTRSGNTWNQQAYVKAAYTPWSGNGFGRSVALSADGNVLAVGAPGDNSSATGVDGNPMDDSAGGSGAVYLFARSSDSWNQQAYVKASNTQAGDFFGTRVALSADGSTLAVGAEGEDSNATGVNGDQMDNSADSSGAVYVFTRNSGAWSQQAYVKEPRTSSAHFFGANLALSGDGRTLAATTPSEVDRAVGVNAEPSDDTAPNGGAVYVFTRSGGSWSQRAYVKAPKSGVIDQFSSSVALSADGGTLAVGASYEGSSATGINGNGFDDSAVGSGAVYLY